MKSPSYRPWLEELDERIVPANVFTVINNANSGAGSLRAAITSANTTANQGDGPDQIVFNIPGGGVQIIALQSQLPDLTQPVIIDGFTQPGASANSDANGNNAVLLIQLDGANAGLGSNGIEIDGDNCIVRGLAIVGFRSNTATGDLADGIEINGDNNTVEGCYLGLTALGVAAGNEATGLRINGGAGNLIGGTAPAARNVLSGNTIGLLIEDATGANNVVQGNFFGTDAAGTGDLGNRLHGVRIGFDAHDNLIGGAAEGAGNVISANGDRAVSLNSHGVKIDGANTTNNTVSGNFIGTDLSGTLNLGNAGSGVHFEDGTHDNVLGGTSAGEGNVIRNNFLAVTLDDNSFNIAILGNSILDSRRAIDLGDDGDDDNDLGDADTGDNNLQNHPVLFGAVQGSTRVNGTLNSTPNTTFRIEFFSSNPETNFLFFRGFGETFLGFVNATTDATGNVDFVAELEQTAPVGHFIAATATDPNGNTSEFSFSVQVAAPGTAFQQFDNLTDSVLPVQSLHVHGTEGNDAIQVRPVGTSKKKFSVKLNGVKIGTFNNITNRLYVFGQGGDDTIVMKGAVKVPAFLFGGAGADTLIGGKAADELRGEAGADTLTGGKGIDRLDGGADTDTIRETGAGNFTLTDAALTRGTTIDALNAVERAILIGDLAVNQMLTTAFTGAVILLGGGGNDVLTSGGGADVLDGGTGKDVLDGGGGRNYLIGGVGGDTLTAGTGRDLLFDGTLNFDIFGAAFALIRAEWERTDIDFAAVVDHLKNGGGFNLDNVLTALTVKKDTQADTLQGGDESDWYFVGQPQDTIVGLTGNDQVN